MTSLWHENSLVQSLVRIVLSADKVMTFVSADQDYDWTLKSECVFQTTVKPPNTTALGTGEKTAVLETWQ